MHDIHVGITDGMEFKMYESGMVLKICMINTTMMKICDSGSKGKGIWGGKQPET